ncbi:hypothetical protein QBC43DRAFT_325618 [Cladorrhinum sp. PSN259]|nr:hypothetical protein QBC43DRAFT_325618 [Cladorrhinum sp. PSN259]
MLARFLLSISMPLLLATGAAAQAFQIAAYRDTGCSDLIEISGHDPNVFCYALKGTTSEILRSGTSPGVFCVCMSFHS